MDWVAPHNDTTDHLLHEYNRQSPTHVPDFSPLVNGLLSTGTTPTVAGEWPIPHVTRNSRTDFRYEFSLSAGPEFDTDSADPHPVEARDEDDTSIDLQGPATSEDTSVGVELPLSHPQKTFAHRSHATSSVPTDPSSTSLTLSNPAASLLTVKKESIPETHLPHSLSPVPNTPAASHPVASTKATAAARPVKSIAKKKNPARKPARIPVSAPNQTASLSGGTSPTNATLSHTKMCRDRLNNMFERLRHTLPPAPSGVEVKHKAQVLDYAIGVLKSMVDRTSQLEIELAVSSNKATMEWISKLVSRVDAFPDAAEEVMKLFARRRGWKHAELWVAGKRPSDTASDPEGSTVLTYGRCVHNDVAAVGLPSLDAFSKESTGFEFRAKEGVQGRVWSSMRPEWVTGLSDPKNFRRAALARKYGLKVCLAVPVTITGKIEAVMCFYDIKHRPYDTQCLELAMRLAWALGNAVGGKRAKVSVLAASGSSST